jgi:outer membrane protein TolC
MRTSFLPSGLVVLALSVVAVRAEAQGEPQAAPPPSPAANTEAQAEVPGLTPASVEPMPVPNDMLRATPEGLTADQVGQRAMETSFATKQLLETMRAAQARINTAYAAFLPRLSGVAKYTRLSEINPPPLALSFQITNPANPTGPPITETSVLPGNTFVPPIWDQWLFQATLTVPISDYLLRINQNYTAATRSTEAARYDIGAAKANALTNGKVAYYSWMQARGQVIVAVQALNDQRVHLKDSRNQFTVGNASKADVLRAETAVASAELTVVTAVNASDLAETQMRIALHIPSGQRLFPGEGLDEQPPPFQGALPSLVQEGLSNRLELKSIKANAEAARQTAVANRAGRYPVLSAFADGIEGNPNLRYFPVTQTFNATWDLGLQATWAPNDILTANSGAADYEARANALEAQAQVTRENIEVEVTQDFQALRQAEFSLDSTRRELASATEAYRVARELFNNGRGTFTTLTDAEGELTRARIDALNAAVNVRLARVRLEHGAGRDVAKAVVAP